MINKKKYKYVSFLPARKGFKEYYRATIRGEFCKVCNTEREAALAIDRHLISKGRSPVNILKPIED